MEKRGDTMGENEKYSILNNSYDLHFIYRRSILMGSICCFTIGQLNSVNSGGLHGKYLNC